MPIVNIYSADRYVIAAEVESSCHKLFQITHTKSDGSLLVMFPYLKGCQGRLGTVTLPGGTNYFKKFTVGENFPVTSHLVKYSHHPTGQAHFSLSGKVRTCVIKKSVPLSKISGHIFTARFQGFSDFSELEKNEKSTQKRGIVPFTFAGDNVESIKFVCHYYSEKELIKRVHHKDSTPWTNVLLPDGQLAVGIPLATPFFFDGERRYLFLAAERTNYVFPNKEKGISFMGGFDPEDVVFNYSKGTSFLLMIIHELADLNELVKSFGTIDL